ncbi:hypothetical protein FIU94_00105 [Sulfitobacter sp. THAF37]|uniref:hypothetical protein n=1 Tax=Sulfitobacter sp. THAF37 TaxID=2587855 RepID=UPI00126918DA|nr:hypothetical protein [Sulfitobacter sp. THAF37]QFT57208.1 hypothetical protein FIU94_00105 [Sulfitobacter sp. THAF37]
MKFNAAGLLLCTFLIGCGGTAPFGEDATEDPTEEGGGTDGGIDSEGLPPGTASPSPNNGIFRSEPRSEEDGANGNGYATGISYDGATDTFTVDGLAFDGGNVYQRGNPVSSLNDGAFSVYEADQQFPDSVTNTPVNQLTHRAIYGVSRNIDANGQPETQFAIVRTGAYVGYGFGGFVYQRANDVNMPSSGQAVFNGRSAGLRDFNGRGGLEYTTANVEVAIDFDDFNDDTGGRGDGVRGEFTNRRVFDIDGNDITAAVLARINNQNDASLSSLPDARFRIGPGVLDGNGEAIGTIASNYTNDEGTTQIYEDGNYYAILSGEDPDEIVGVIVIENSAEFDSTVVRETSGFIVHRTP